MTVRHDNSTRGVTRTGWATLADSPCPGFEGGLSTLDFRLNSMTQFLFSLLTAVVMVHIILVSCAYLIFLERKVAAWIQNRVGPNRTNLSFGLLPFKGTHFGLGQALADGMKLFFKEDYSPPKTERTLFLLAPMLATIPAMIAWAVIPWGGKIEWDGQVFDIAVAPIDIGVVWILASGSLAVYGVVLAGYASNNKYSFLGGLRATAQMLSYEIPMGLCVLIMILVYGSMRADDMTLMQAGATTLGGDQGVWGVILHPLLAIIFFTCVLAECNRAPFDLAEAEQELVGGFHTEYSSMKWALFFLGEYMHMISGAAFFTVLFLGGWDFGPGFVLPEVGGIGLVLLKSGIFMGKVGVLLFVMMWIRWTLPRFRFDQLMRLAWRGLIPLTLCVLLATAFLVFFNAPAWSYLAANIVIAAAAAIISPLIPEGAKGNRRVELTGSRFSPPKAA